MFAVKHWPWTLTVLASGWLVHVVGVPTAKVGLYVITAACLVGVAAICVHEQRGYLRIGREAAVEAGGA